MASCFDNIPHENLEHCPNDEINGGLATTLYHVPVVHVKSFAAPTINNTYESRVKVGTGGIVLVTGKSWKKIDIQKDMNELKSILSGNVGNKKSKAELEFLIPGLKAKGLGFVDAYKNVPSIYAVKDGNGKFIVIGTKDYGAYIDTADGTTGKNFDDDSGITCKIVANHKPLIYEGEISLEPAS